MLHSWRADSPLVVPSGRLQYIAAGQSGVVYGIDEEKILKQYDESHEGDVERDVERRAYERLGPHPNIAKYLGSTEDGGMILERGYLLRTVCRQTGTDQIPLRRKLHWLRHAAEGIQHMHENGILQCDVGSHNMILTRGDILKIIDLAGVSIDGGAAGSRYEWFSYRPSTPEVSRQTDIFAFGCVAYEIMTGRQPYHEFETFSDRARRVEQLYQNNQFPDVTHLPLGEVIRCCWHGTFNSMGEVIQALEMASRSNLKTKSRFARVLKRSWCFN